MKNQEQVIYFEAVCDNTLKCFHTESTKDYKNKIRHLKSENKSVAVIFREWNSGKIEDGELEVQV